MPNLIKTNQYYQIASAIKNYEDTLQKMFLNSKSENDMLDLLKDYMKKNKSKFKK